MLLRVSLGLLEQLSWSLAVVISLVLISGTKLGVRL
jgi:hypothetical protein